MSTVTLDFSKAKPLPVTLDFSKAQPISNPSDDRNAIQKSFDQNTQTSPKDSLLETGLKSVVGAIASPFIHPLDTLSGMAHAVAHPIDQVHSEVNQLYQDKADGGLGYAGTKFAGNVLGSVALGEAGGAAGGALMKGLPSAAGKLALLGKTPEAAYESALKPSVLVDQSTRAALVKTGLEKGLPVSKSGVEKLGGLIDELNSKIKDTINYDPTRPIDPNSVATRADDAKAKFSQQVNASKDLKAIEDSKQLFLKEQGATNGNPAPPMNAADAQAMKQGTYQILAGKYGEMGTASMEAQKALARGLKEEIASQFPEISDLNADESRLLDLKPLLERAVNRIANHQAIGIGTPVVGAAAKAITRSSSIAVVASVLKGVLDNPALKSRLAIAVSKGAKIPYGEAVAKVAAYSASLGSTSETPGN
jgi:hypothetical protein